MLLPLVRENAHMRLTDLPTDLLQCRHRAADWGIIRHSPLCSELYRPDGHGCDNGSNIVSSPRKPRSDQLELVYWACRFQQAPSSRRCVFYAEPKRGFLTGMLMPAPGRPVTRLSAGVPPAAPTETLDYISLYIRRPCRCNTDGTESRHCCDSNGACSRGDPKRISRRRVGTTGYMIYCMRW